MDGRNPGPFCDALNLSASAVAEENNLEFHKYDFLQRGADERQYASPHVDLDVGTLCNSKFGEYPEYHNSSDNLDIISDQALAMSAEIVLRAIGLFACNEKPVMVDPCEPMLSKHGLYPHTRNYSATQEQVMQMLNLLLMQMASYLLSKWQRDLDGQIKSQCRPLMHLKMLN